MNANPCPNLGLIITIQFPGKALTSCDIKRRLTSRMSRMQVRFLVTLTLFWSHRYEYAIEKR